MLKLRFLFFYNRVYFFLPFFIYSPAQWRRHPFIWRWCGALLSPGELYIYIVQVRKRERDKSDFDSFAAAALARALGGGVRQRERELDFAPSLSLSLAILSAGRSGNQ